jgi:hypothetical protein
MAGSAQEGDVPIGMGRMTVTNNLESGHSITPFVLLKKKLSTTSELAVG